MKYFLLGVAAFVCYRLICTFIMYRKLDKYGNRMLKVYSKLALSIITSCTPNNHNLRIGELIARSMHSHLTYSGCQNLDTHLVAIAKFEYCKEEKKSDQFKMKNLYLLTDAEVKSIDSIDNITEESLIKDHTCLRFEQGDDNKLDMYLGDERLDPGNRYDLKYMIKLLKTFNDMLYKPSSMNKNFVDLFAIDFTEFRLLNSERINTVLNMIKDKEWKEV